MRGTLIGFGSTAMIAGLLSLPVLVDAQTAAQGLLGTLALFNRILNGLVGLAILAAILAFFWGLIKWLFTKSADEKASATRMMITGIVAIFIMVSIWGIIRLLQNTFGVTQNTSITPAGIQSF
jgi:hypothetical protein